MGMKEIEVVSINDLLQEVDSATVPHERQVVEAVISIWKEDPSTESLGIAKLHSIVKQRHANWSLSEKRVKSLLKKFGLSPNSENEQYSYAKDITSEKTPGLTLPDSVNLVMTSKRGKGLFARMNILKGEVIWEEAPLFLVPLLAHAELINSGRACAYCGKLVNEPSRTLAGLSVLRGLDCNICQEIWCSLQCKNLNTLKHAATKHGSRATRKIIDVEAYERLVHYCIKEQWNALYSITEIFADILLDKDGLKEEQFKAMARVSQKVRYKALSSSAGAFDSLQGGAMFVEEQQELLWEKGYDLFCEVFPTASESKSITFDEFLFMLGTYNINNLDSSVYLIQSHMNHNCGPNTSVETSVKRSEGLKVVAKSDIKVGEELTTSYVNPGHAIKQRQRELRVNWGFLCKCSKCKADLSEQHRRKSSGAAGTKDRAEIKNMLELTSRELGDQVELEIPLDFNGERRKSVRFDDKVVKVT